MRFFEFPSHYIYKRQKNMSYESRKVNLPPLHEKDGWFWFTSKTPNFPKIKRYTSYNQETLSPISRKYSIIIFTIPDTPIVSENSSQKT